MYIITKRQSVNLSTLSSNISHVGSKHDLAVAQW